MKHINKKVVEFIVKQSYSASALVIFFAIVVCATPNAVAAAQITTRSIQMSDSAPANVTATSGVGSGTSVTYNVSFVLPVASLSFIIDFCADSAIIGSTCGNSNTTYPGISTFTVASSTVTNSAGTVGTWTLTKSQYQIKLAGAATASTAGATQTFTINSVTNPGTGPLVFYARMYSFANNSFGTYASAANVGNALDSGAVAMTTNNVITITAKVQESLIFCVFGGQAPLANCAANTSSVAPALTLGHGTNTTLDSSAIDTATAYSELSTNAASGAVVRLHSSVAGGGLANGGSTIPAANTGAATASAQTAGTAFFGLTIATSTNGTGGSGSTTVSAPYSGGGSNFYGMDTTSAQNVTTAYGSQLMSTTSNQPVNFVNNVWTFAASASNTTPAGIYSANLAAIATGTF